MNMQVCPDTAPRSVSYMHTPSVESRVTSLQPGLAKASSKSRYAYICGTASTEVAAKVDKLGCCYTLNRPDDAAEKWHDIVTSDMFPRLGRESPRSSWSMKRNVYCARIPCNK